MTLYCIFHKREMIAMYHSEKDAINQMITYWYEGLKNLTIKGMSIEEYKKYFKKFFKRG